MNFEVQELLAPFGISANSIQKLEGYESTNYKITDDQGEAFVLKHYSDNSQRKVIEEEIEFISLVKKNLSYEISYTIPHNGRYIQDYNDGSYSRLLPFIEGEFLGEANITATLSYDFGKAMAQMVLELEKFKPIHFERKQSEWDLQFAIKNKPLIDCIESPEQRKLAHYFLDQFEQFTYSKLLSLPRQLIHNDFNEWNVLCKDERICGVIDFGDATVAPYICELAIGLAYIMQKQKLPLAIACEVIRGFTSLRSMSTSEIEILPSLITARLCTSVCASAKAKKESFDTDYILISEQGGWDLLEKWIGWNPKLIINQFLKAAGHSIKEDKSYTSVEKKRNKHFISALSLSYKNPIYMSSAAFQYMYDSSGNAYLDAYNNIPLVGHSHPKVSEAASRQIRLLNTNTRYHNDSLYEYAERILELFPDNLNKVFFVNSGTEANDLAQRLANNFTNRNDRIVVEMGYHGHTSELINLSPYKYNGKGGLGKKEHICELPLPKQYKGKYDDVNDYLTEAKEMIQKNMSEGRSYSSFLLEPISGCGGQVPLMTGYLEALVPWLQRKGMLVISDEVQIGFGRLGRWFWGHEMQNFLPDIVVMGKPMGNGFPIAAVVTTQEIADRFDNGMEFFSSFGGNPVATEVGLSVLNVLEEEGLQARALDTGDYLMNQIKQLQNVHSVIGDVRGEGLFVGIEFTNADGTPGSEVCNALKNRLKDRFILTGSDGKYDEVIKMKPPLCFNRNNVDRVVSELDNVLRKSLSISKH
jgi:4-aminobutyrate aminotransferase-like enzyme/Ser/Thr protein kinase RdoA (MazF antagonist)